MVLVVRQEEAMKLPVKSAGLKSWVIKARVEESHLGEISLIFNTTRRGKLIS